ncbi:hypothetical protein B0H12DRAFT_1113790 [Mycena haematopus]|nr:hypothetical protein B0H12DRAFT_1113790 [Mycena haematopus]
MRRSLIARQDFEKALKEVVLAKRLSASKMNNLTEIALKSMQDDTQLVSILYRTHKSLQAAAKVSSLYVFDALARAARSQVVKQGLTGDINSRKGNCATFLLKVEGVLEGLFQDMISSATSEAKVSSWLKLLAIGDRTPNKKAEAFSRTLGTWSAPRHRAHPGYWFWLVSEPSVLVTIFYLSACFVGVEQS